MEKAKTIFSANLQNAISYFPKIESIPDKVLQYLFDAIARTLSDDSYQFDNEKIQHLITIASERISDKSMVDQLRRLLNIKMKNNGKSSNDDDQQFKQSIIEMYNNNPPSVTRILDLTKEIDVNILA